jgi:hypothetical protein
MIKSQILSARDNINSWYHINETSYRDLLEKYDIKLLPVISIKRNEKRFQPSVRRFSQSHQLYS